MERMVIRHISGSKANQNEQFPLETFNELTFGRDQGSTVSFDPERDDLVSRRHAVIRVVKGDRLGFVIADLNSSNGSFVNGRKLTGESEILPGDEVEFGKGGPKFIFDVEPRPAHLVRRTREIEQPASTAAATRQINVGELSSTAGASAATGAPSISGTQKVGYGKATVDYKISQATKANSRMWMYGLAGVLAVVAVVAGLLYWQNQKSHDQAVAEAQKQVEAAKKEAEQLAESAKATIASKVGEMTPRDIAQKYGDATVYIEMGWRLYDSDTGKLVFHKIVDPFYNPKKKDSKPNPLPGYVRLSDGKVYRWLVTDDEDRTNHLISGAGSGSGFVVTNDGFVLTNKHVAAGWLVPYQVGAHEQQYGLRGWLFDVSGPKLEISQIDLRRVPELLSWVPGDGGYLFTINPPSPRPARFEGRSDVLDIQFPDTKLPLSARFIRAHSGADVALIKIDTPKPVDKTELAGPDDPVVLGEPVTVMGYPGLSEKTIALETTAEAGNIRKQAIIIPSPTITEGIISKIGRGLGTIDENTIAVGQMGDVYQLTVTATGHGNSGGPVFNGSGKVIALFTYAISDPYAGERITFAVPIKYGRELMQLVQVN